MTNSFDGDVLYVVADGAKARFLRHKDGRFTSFETLDASKQHGTPGMTPSGSSASEHNKSAFARTVADHINGLVSQGKAKGGIVLAAPAEALHDIRGHLNKAATDAVLKTLVKDLTSLTDHDLPSHFDVPETGWTST